MLLLAAHVRAIAGDPRTRRSSWGLTALSARRPPRCTPSLATMLQSKSSPRPLQPRLGFRALGDRDMAYVGHASISDEDDLVGGTVGGPRGALVKEVTFAAVLRATGASSWRPTRARPSSNKRVAKGILLRNQLENLGVIAVEVQPLLRQDFTGVPTVVDLACMRDAASKLGTDPDKINPLESEERVIGRTRY